MEYLFVTSKELMSYSVFSNPLHLIKLNLFSKDNLNIPTHWTFWYCNNVGVTSPSISPWHCCSVGNQTHDDVNLRYQPGIRILRLDRSNFNIVMTSSWYHTLSSTNESPRIIYLVLRMSPADVIRTSQYGLIRNSKRNPTYVLRTS